MNNDAEAGEHTKPLYRGMDRAALDAAYNNLRAVPTAEAQLSRWGEQSAAIRASGRGRLDVAYGPRERQRLDYFPSGKPKAPLFVFIHGGYWQGRHKDGFSFVIEGPNPHGIDVAVVGYTLAPQARLTDIVAEMHMALTYLDAHHADLGYDRRRLFVGGWSAGGHLTASVADHPAFRGGIPISGIFDLAPIALNYLNDKLSLSPEEIEALSPLRRLPDKSPPLIVMAGARELPELVRQSVEFAGAARARGLPVRLMMLEGHDHFSIMDELARPDGALTRQLVELIAAAS